MNARLEYKIIRTYIPPKQISGIAGTGNSSEICLMQALSQNCTDLSALPSWLPAEDFSLLTLLGEEF